MRHQLYLTLALIAAPSAASTQSPLVYRIDVTGTVENGLAPYVARGIREAETAGAKAVYLNIDTPGGRIDAAERISDAVRGAAIPVYAFVNPRAFSAGALIAISANAVYMRPGAVMGAATPVDGAGNQGLGEDGVRDAGGVPRGGGAARARSANRRGDGGRAGRGSGGGRGGPAADSDARAKRCAWATPKARWPTRRRCSRPWGSRKRRW